MSTSQPDNRWGRADAPGWASAPRWIGAACTVALAALLAVAPGTAGAATTTCPAASPDTCAGARSALFALAHSNVDPTQVLVRVSVPAWSPGTVWGDGVNGFFYRVTAGGTVANYTPFNGMAVGSDGAPALPAFTFLASVPETATTLEVAACASGFAGSGDTPTCTTTLWTDTYAPLPTPVLTEEPYGSATLVFSGSSTVLVPATGVYATAVQLTVTVEDDLGNPAPPADVQWLLDRLVFFDTAGNPQTNTIEPTGDPGNPQGIGVLPLAQAAFQDPQSGDWLTKYGNTSPHTAPLAPSQLLFVYTRNGAGSQTTIGLSPIYDESASCLGKTTAGCAAPSAPHPQLVISAESDRATTQTVLDFDTGETLPSAGTQRTRRAQVLLSTPDATCETIVNPLGVNTTNDGVTAAYNPPDYVIDDAAPFGGQARGKTFPPALYYVVPAGFGSCASTEQPFCAETAGYAAYGPRYLDVDGSGGSSDGGSTEASTLGGFEWHDEYALPALGTAGSNTQGFFDNCGYWHTYVEQVAGGQRLALSSLKLPDAHAVVDYTISNALDRDVVFAKECCASFYQTNTKVTPNVQEPPHVLDNGFGAFLPAGATLSYQTIFSQEAMVVLDAMTGARLFKVHLDAADANQTKPYACTASWSLDASGMNVTLGGSGSSCAPGSDVFVCPLGATTAQNGAEYTCTFTDSSFALAVPEWVEGLTQNDVQAVQLRSWGSQGPGSDGGAGAAGFGLTVMAPLDLASQDDPAIAEGAGGLYAYTGRDGSSTILGQVPLSALSTSNGTDLEGQEPSALQVLVLAGAGGGGGENEVCPNGNGGTSNTKGKAGGAGGVALANASSFPSAPQFAGGSKGADASGSTGGCGGTGATTCTGGHSSGQGGPGGWSDSQGWNDGGTLIPPTSTWAPGKGGSGAGDGSGGAGCGGGEGGRGGGGFGGGGGGKDASGGGGGGSWAAGNTAYDATAPVASSIPASPGGTNGAVQLAYVQGPCSVDRSGVRPVVRCTYMQSLVGSTALDVTGLVDTLFGDVDAGTLAQMPVYTEAWGARGGTGGTAAEDGGTVTSPGGAGGTHGYARSSQTWQALEAFLGGADLQLYVGQVGSTVGQQPAADPSGGGGGSSTLVTSQVLSAGATSDPRAAGVFVLAGGGGGGGSGDLSGFVGASGLVGGGGGVVMAGTAADASAAGGSGGGLNGGKGAGGDGTGGCAHGQDASQCGVAGLGGLGGATSAGPASWQGGYGTGWTAGNGGQHGATVSGGGGGGWGGGAGAGAACTAGIGCGGGGGGSWARQASLDDTGAPTHGTSGGSPAGTSGAVMLTFDICAVDPDNTDYCLPGAVGITAAHARVQLVRRGNRVVRLWLHGSADFDVRDLDLTRLRMGVGMQPLRGLWRGKARDRNKDGFADLRFDLSRDAAQPASPDAVECVYGARLKGSPFVGCARPQTVAQLRAAAKGTRR